MYRKSKWILFPAMLLILVSSLSAAEKLSPEIKEVIERTMFRHSTWGLLAVDLESGETIYELNADTMFKPGSTTKVFTVSAALDLLGADYRFETPVYRRGKILKSGGLEGDLILVATGDITLGGRTTQDGHIAFTDIDHDHANDFDGAQLTAPDPAAGISHLAKQVAESGIKKVVGEVVVDDRFFDPAARQAGLNPVMINDNLIDLVITPTKPGLPSKVEWRPRSSFYRMDVRIRTIEEGQPTQIDIRTPGSGQIVARGQISIGQDPAIRVVRVEDPASFVRSLFIEALLREGVDLNASPIDMNPTKLLPAKADYKNLPQVACLVSLPFSEYARLILKVSHNQAANTLIQLIALHGGNGTYEDGFRVEGEFLSKAGIDLSSVSLADGAGGEPGDLFSPRAIVDLLRHMALRPDHAVLLKAMPSLGVDGTLAKAVKPDSPARGKVHSKTGTIISFNGLKNQPILNAKGLAGYMTTSSGRDLSLAIFVNNTPVETVDEALSVGNTLGEICELIYKTE